MSRGNLIVLENCLVPLRYPLRLPLLLPFQKIINFDIYYYRYGLTLSDKGDHKATVKVSQFQVNTRLKQLIRICNCNPLQLISLRLHQFLLRICKHDLCVCIFRSYKFKFYIFYQSLQEIVALPMHKSVWHICKTVSRKDLPTHISSLGDESGEMHQETISRRWFIRTSRVKNSRCRNEARWE